MIICACHYVSESAINIAIEFGNTTLEKIGDFNGAGTCCGACHECIEQLIDISSDNVKCKKLG